jgi:secreted Zn-dependent insulinase-like peptidase
VPQALALLAAGSGAVVDPLPPAEAAAGQYPTLARTQSDPSNVNSEVAITWQIPATSPACTDLFLRYASSTNASAAAATGLPTPSEVLLATANVFAKVIKEPFVNALRTQQQIGYLVGSELRITDGVASFELIAKSAQYGTSDIQARMAAFVASVETTVLGKLTSADVEGLTNTFAVRDKELLSQVQLRAFMFALARFFPLCFQR